jgi:hypothetical protein
VESLLPVQVTLIIVLVTALVGLLALALRS